MSYLIGTDEAGYGPNLGPLVVSATLWELPDPHIHLYDELSPWICAPAGHDSSCLLIGDSKSIYQQGTGIGQLERSVLAMLRVAGLESTRFSELARQLCGLTPHDLQRQRPYDWNCLDIPLAADLNDIDQLADHVARGLQSRRVELARIRCSALFADEFNGALHDCDNKATLLSTSTCQLVRPLLDELATRDPTGDVLILCDKHGGRKCYAALLQRWMTEEFVEVVGESRQSSVYRWRETARNIEFHFLVKGEHRLPIALASMTAKYFRELSMKAWNSFWQFHLPKIRPTAGYPQDAKRFKRDIADRQLALGISDRSIWRRK